MSGAHRFDPSVLRAYDVRGQLGPAFGEADARALGRAFATRLGGGRADPRICVGYDGRLSSPKKKFPSDPCIISQHF